MRKLYNLIFLLVPGIWLTGCYPYPDESNFTSDFDAVYTAKAPDFENSKPRYVYYSHTPSDSIEIITGQNQNERKYIPVSEAVPIISAVNSWMRDEYNYTLVEVDDIAGETDPRLDSMLYINIFAVEITNSGVIWGPCYGWGGYWGWYPPYNPGWGWGGYPCYYPSSYYSYQTGTLFMDMVDIKESDPCDSETDRDCQIDVAWNATLNGLLSSSGTERAVAATEQAFRQSEYLRR